MAGNQNINMNNTLAQFADLANTMIAEEAQKPMAQHIPTDELFSTLDLSLADEAMDEAAFIASFKELVLSTPKTATKAFFNQLFGGRNEKAILGELFAVLLNNSMYTYKAAGPQIGVEKVVLEKVNEIIGWGPQSGGTFAPGGSMSNYMALLMARDVINKDIRHQGVRGAYTAYTSEASHYSISKNAAFAGIGRDQVRKIKTDDQGKMIPAELKEQIKADLAAGYTPFFVNATAGTTVLGAFDDIISLRNICDEFGLWLHVDGAYCGAVLFSKKYKHLIKGIENVDSFSFNAHKMLGTPLSCSLIMVKDKQHLNASFSNDASYLYQTDDDEFNPGKTSLQCGRRNDALKFWTLWKSVGTDGLEAIVDQQFHLADVARKHIRNNPDYTLYSFDESVSICFNYKDIPARDICTALYEHNELMVGYGSFDGEEFIRLVTVNAQNTDVEILEFFEKMEKFVAETLSIEA